MRIYRHTQMGTAILFVLGLGIAGSATVWILVPTARVVVGLVLVILLVSVVPVAHCRSDGGGAGRVVRIRSDS